MIYELFHLNIKLDKRLQSIRSQTETDRDRQRLLESVTPVN